MLFKRCQVDVHVHGHRAEIDATLCQSHFVGIVVEPGRHTALKRIGRVPLGSHPKGRLRLHWNLKVNGKRLPPAATAITLRALDKQGNVLGLSRPDTVRVRG